ncbi:MAG: hypothetical protein JXO22_02990, partial [Phycisphaerae bacterium]|nr:hypothetical protein [Phycisphaerae bacterium]
MLQAGLGIAILLFMPVLCLAQSPTIDDLLRSVGVEPREVGIHETDLALMVGTRPRSPMSQLLMTEPLRADAMAGVIAQLLANSGVDKPVDSLSTLSRFTGRTVRRGLVGDPLARLRETAKSDGAFAEALRRCGARRVSPDEMDAVPPSVREATTLLLLAMLDAQPWVDRAMASAGDERWWTRLERELRKTPPESTGDANEAEPDTDYQLQYKQCAEQFANQWML